MIEFTRIVASIKYLSVYTCVRCGKRQAGTTGRAEFDGFSAEGLKNFMNRQRQRSHDMPVGWCCDSSGFTCGCRKKEEA